MRVLQVMASGDRGGGASHLRALCRELSTQGADVVVAIGDDGPSADQLQATGLTVHRHPMMAGRWDKASTRWLDEIIARARPDVIHAHGTRAAFHLLRTRRARPLPLVYTAHMLAHRTVRGLATRAAALCAEALVCRRANHVITVSRSDLEHLRGLHLVAARRVTHIPNAVELQRFAAHGGAAARQLLGLRPDERVVGSVGRLVPQKAVDILIEAVARMHAPPVLVIVGDGEERASLEQLAASLSVDARWLGARDDVPALLPALDVFALASRWEAEGIVLLEAMAAAVLPVATATPGANELMGAAGLTSFLVRRDDPDDLAASLSRALELAEDERSALLIGARESLAQRSPAVMAERTLAVYSGLAASPDNS